MDKNIIEYIASNILHDFAGNLGLNSNCAEMIKNNMHDDEIIELMLNNANDAVNKLKCYRIAFGNSSNAKFETSEIAQIIKLLFNRNNSNIIINTSEINGYYAKILLLILLRAKHHGISSDNMININIDENITTINIDNFQKNELNKIIDTNKNYQNEEIENEDIEDYYYYLSLKDIDKKIRIYNNDNEIIINTV